MKKFLGLMLIEWFLIGAVIAIVAVAFVPRKPKQYELVCSRGEGDIVTLAGSSYCHLYDDMWTCGFRSGWYRQIPGEACWSRRAAR